MKFSTVLSRIPAWYEARKCVYLKSPPGRGKTSVLLQTAALLSRVTGKNMGVVLINGPLLTPADSIGYLVPKRAVDSAGVEHMESVYTDPFWFRTRDGKRIHDFEGGIIIVDEMDKADVDVKKVIGEAALTGRLGPHQLPEGWIIWMAGNRQKDRSGSTKELDHLINRRMEIDVTDDLDSWNDWANANGVPSLYMAFTNQNPQIVFSDGVPEKQGPWCTPRSLVEAARYHEVLASHNNGVLPDDDATIEEISGLIGEAATAQLFSFVKLEKEMPKYEDIIADPNKAKLPGKPDAMMLVCYNLAHRVKAEHADAVINYIDRLPKEFGVIFGRSAVQRDPKLVILPAFTRWVKANSSLMASIGNHAR